MNIVWRTLQRGVALGLIGCLANGAIASSHMDAPLITLDPSANTTDVYAFVDEEDDQKSLVVALGVYPFEEPGIGPNKYNFDDNVLYEIHLAIGTNAIANGEATVTYQWKFTTTFANSNTILQSYLGIITNIHDSAQNLRQTYTVTKVDRQAKKEVVTELGTGLVPPNNQGIATPFYNQGDDGDNRAKPGVSSADDLDSYTKQAITNLLGGHVAFAGQRDDGFYSDIQGVFDLLQLSGPNKPFDSQGGYNLHLMALEIPVSEIGGDQQIVGVWATTSRQAVKVKAGKAPQAKGKFVQVARQGNPLFNEGLVAIADKDTYSRTTPADDATLFAKYALSPELAALLGSTFPTNRTDIAGIFIPDVIKVDLSTPGARLTGTGGDDANSSFSRLSIFGGDVLQSTIQDPFQNGGLIPGGWPNGRRFGDDVVDIAVTALISDLRDPSNLVINVAGDTVVSNDVTYNLVFPYESTPQNGRNHKHHGQE